MSCLYQISTKAMFSYSTFSHPGIKMINFASVICLILLAIPLTTPLNFSLSGISPNTRGIVYDANATVADSAIQLTVNLQNVNATFSIGRATYDQPLLLWDRASGNRTDFSTNFTFSISSNPDIAPGDGFTFFLVPNGARFQDNAGGGGLGLVPDYEALNYTDNPFVAVEFDIFQNSGWDASAAHVGIDINSMKSVANQTWPGGLSSFRSGMLYEAMITYDSSSQNLSLVLNRFNIGTTFSNRTSDVASHIQNLSYRVNLSEILPENVTFGFSAASGTAAALHVIYAWSFSSNLELDTSQTMLPPVSAPVLPNSGNGNSGLVIGLAVGGSILALVLGLTIYFFLRRKNKEVDEDFDVELGDEFEQGAGPKRFSYSELAKATGNFAEQEKLGEGGFGGVYRGFLRDMGSYIAVKRVSRGSSQGVKEYASEVKIISRLRHKNLVQLHGWCHQKQELLLVYEFMPNESLDHHLFKGKSLLDWGTRFKIARGLTSALLYLHEEWEQCVVHRDIKSSNVMLDANFNAKLGDFGLARLVDHEKGSQTTVLAGTMGYMAPECMITGKASKETDVFSFGVVALEIASGRKPINPKAEQGQIHLVEWAWRLYGTGNIFEASDPQLGTEYDSREMEQLMVVGLWCAHPISELRPTIKQAIRVLNFEAPLPELPERMPVPMYCIPSTDAHLSPFGTILSGSSYTYYDENTSSSKFTASSQESTSSTYALLQSIN